MKVIKHIIFSLFAGIGMTACNADGEMITTDGASAAVTLTGSGDVVLNRNSLGSLALTLYWEDNGTLSLSDDAVQAPQNAITNTLQFSANNRFDNVVEQLVDKGVTYTQFTMESLNTLAGRLGLESGVASPMYIRIRSVLAANMEAQYSNIYQVNVTPYTLDMAHASILDTKREATGWTLGSAESNGIYSGFLGVTGWYNFWLQEGNGILWGNDGVTGTPFLISSEDSHWNFWYPGPEGCYYTVVNTHRQEWSALHIPYLKVTGDITGEMVYNRKLNKWMLSFTANQTGAATIRIAGTGAQYNVNTKTDDAAAIATPVGFGQDGRNLTFGTEATDIMVNIPTTGKMTLVLDLSNPLAWTCTAVKENNNDEPTIVQHLWTVGIDDGISGNWGFNQSLTLTDKDHLAYAGVVNINSLWGYRLYTERDVWTGFYGKGQGDEKTGELIQEAKDNIPAPEAGLYVLQASLSAMTYTTFAVNSVQITGINDDWHLTQMKPTGTPGMYTASLNVTSSTPWGYKILINENWNTFFGGTASQLLYNKANIPFDDSYIGSICTFTVDLCKGTINITK